jgi:predicted MFS family arabinose efflux permease
MPPPILKAPPVLFTPNFILLFIAGLFFGLAFWPYVLLPVFLQNLGADLLVVGILMGAASFSGIVVRPWVGSALDRVGRRKCLITGGLIFFLAHLLYLSVDTIGWVVYAVRLLHGLGMGMLMATFFTLAADLSPQVRKTEGIAIFGISGHLSGTIGVTMGEEIIRWGGYGSLFMTCAGLSLVSILFSLGIPEPGHHRPEGPREGFLSLLLSPSLRVPLFATVAFALSLSSYMVFLKPYALSVGIGSVTPFFVAYTLTAVGIRIIGGNWPDRFGLKRVIYPAMVLLSVGILLLVIQPTPAGLVAGGILAGIGHGFIFPILSVMIIGSEQRSNQGSLMTLFTMVFDLGLFIGAPLLGWIAMRGDYASMFIVAALVQVATLAAFVLFKQES